MHWEKVGVVLPGAGCEQRGIAAPAAWVRNGRVHLFYQTYGNGPKDAICHAWCDDGLHFTRNPRTPSSRPPAPGLRPRDRRRGHPVGDRLFLWFATRDPAMKMQMQGVAAAPLDSDYGRAQWTQLVDGPVLKPELPWERNCIEAARSCSGTAGCRCSTPATTTTSRSKSAWPVGRRRPFHAPVRQALPAQRTARRVELLRVRPSLHVPGRRRPDPPVLPGQQR